MKFKLVVIIASRGDIYDVHLNTYWKKTVEYCSKNLKQIHFKFIFNNSSLDGIEIPRENILNFDRSESFIPGILQKTIDSFEYLLQNIEFEYLLRTNLSRFWIFDKFLKVLDTMVPDKVYSGFIGNHRGSLFCSGAGFLLSYDMIQYIIENKNLLNYDILDDVSIGMLLHDLKKEKLERCDYFINIRNLLNLTDIFDNFLKMGMYHFRLKSLYSRELEKEISNILTTHLYT
jgi:hypothetical protein